MAWSKEERREYMREYNKKYYQENKKEIDRRQKEWRKQNPDKVRASRKATAERRQNDFSKLASVLYAKTLTSKRRKGRMLKNNLSTEYIQTILEKQNYCCAITGIKLDHRSGKNNLRMASVDRIDSRKGYVKGNIQIVLNGINKLKGESSVADVLKLLREYAKISCKLCQESNRLYKYNV